MILELVELSIHPQHNQAFENTVLPAIENCIASSPGFQGFKLNRGIEDCNRYVLQIFWATLEDHTVTFRNSPAFGQWRQSVGPFLASTPVVQHFELIAKSDTAT